MRKGIVLLILGLLTVVAVPTFAQTERSIAQIADADSRFDTLTAALQAADLDGVLGGEGAFTVFAPTDDAFAALPEGTLEALLADIPTLTDILTYHVVAGEVPAATVVTLNRATSLLGEEVLIQVTEDGVVLNGSVNVLVTDIQASNGIIHVIDAVLLPPARGLNNLTFIGSDTPVLSAPNGVTTASVARTCQTYFVTETLQNFGYVPSVFGWIDLTNTQQVSLNYGQPGGPKLC